MMFSDEPAACVDLQSSWRRSRQSSEHQSVLSNRLLTAIPHGSFKSLFFNKFASLMLKADSF